MQIQRKKLTKEGCERRNRIIEKLITKQKKTLLLMNLYVGVLQPFKEYVVLFQAKEPQIHKISQFQLEVFKTFLNRFVKSKKIVNMSPSMLKKSFEIKEDYLYPTNEMLVGRGTKLILKEMDGKHPDVVEFYCNVKKAFLETAKYMQNKLPLDNELFICLSAINPLHQFENTTATYLDKLIDFVKNVLNEEEKDSYQNEVLKYTIDEDLPAFKPSPHSNGQGHQVRIDVWWGEVLKTGRFPNLAKLILAVLSCFSGPIVESSFNAMGDILDKRTFNLHMESYKGYQTVQYFLRAHGHKAIQYFTRQDPHRSNIDTVLCNNIQTSSFRYRSDLKTQEVQVKEGMKHRQLNLISKVKAKKEIEKLEKEHLKNELKRKNNGSKERNKKRQRLLSFVEHDNRAKLKDRERKKERVEKLQHMCKKIKDKPKFQ